MNLFSHELIAKAEKIAIFCGESFLKFLTSFAKVHTKLRDVVVKDGSVTATDGGTVTLNRKTDFYLDEKLNVLTTTMCYIADVIHEFGHILYTCFEIHWAIQKEDYDASFLSSDEKKLIDREVVEWCKENKLTRSERVALADLNNIVEDGGMERQASKLGKFIERCIRVSNLVIANRRPDLNELASKNASDYDILVEATLSYAVNRFVHGSFENDEIKKVFEENIIPLLKSGINSDLSIDRFIAARGIFEVLRPYLKTKSKNENKPYENHASSSAPQMDVSSNSGNANDDDSNQSASQKPQKSSRQTPDQASSSCANKDDKTGDKGDKSDNSNGDGNENEDANDESQKANSNSTQNSNSKPTDNGEIGDGFGGEEMDSLYNENDIESSINEVTEDAEKEISEQVIQGVNDILDERAEEKARKKRELVNRLNFSMIGSDMIKGGNLCNHAGVKINAVMANEDRANDEKYYKIVDANSETIEVFRAYFEDLLKPAPARRYYSKDGANMDDILLFQTPYDDNIFYDVVKRKKKAPFKVIILIDASGSMAGEKIDAALNAAIVLSEVFEQLDIPFTVMTHSASYPNVKITCYKHLDNNNDDKTKLASINVRDDLGCNRDGVAIRFVQQFIDGETERVIVFSISDGQPNDGQYKGAAAIADTKLAVQQLSEVADVYGIGIGGFDERKISQIYENYAVVTNLADLPSILMNQIEV